MEGMEDKAKITNITTVNWGIQTQKEFKLSVNSGFEPLLQQIDVLSPSLFATRMYCGFMPKPSSGFSGFQNAPPQTSASVAMVHFGAL
mmetsp:Transcript_11978/g.26089  ORF Transcript_11978/g.26089 Transcript_11978/m.26089 type:complete len:88 (+) Transcript_11978:344-607(+)